MSPLRPRIVTRIAPSVSRVEGGFKGLEGGLKDVEGGFTTCQGREGGWIQGRGGWIHHLPRARRGVDSRAWRVDSRAWRVDSQVRFVYHGEASVDVAKAHYKKQPMKRRNRMFLAWRDMSASGAYVAEIGREVAQMHLRNVVLGVFNALYYHKVEMHLRNVVLGVFNVLYYHKVGVRGVTPLGVEVAAGESEVSGGAKALVQVHAAGGDAGVEALRGGEGGSQSGGNGAPGGATARQSPQVLHEGVQL
eukprot:1190767-Prorocentrum_minimum.AAC.2